MKVVVGEGVSADVVQEHLDALAPAPGGVPNASGASETFLAVLRQGSGSFE
jgi:hypothetical protein